MPHFAASDLGLHCLPITLMWVSRLEWVKFGIIAELLPFREMSREIWKFSESMKSQGILKKVREVTNFGKVSKKSGFFFF